MNTNFQKTQYDGQLGFRLHHTIGSEASGSTLDYSHRHFTNMLIYFIHGTGSIRIEGKHYDICEGDMILLNPTELFCCTVESNVFHERIVLYVSDSFLSNFSCAAPDLLTPFTGRDKGLGNRISAQTARAHKLDALLSGLLKLSQSPTPNTQLLSLCKMGELLVHLKEATSPGCRGELTMHDTLADNILAYLNSHYQQSISLSTIADIFGFHKSYLSHLFTEQVGMSLWNYVILRRLNAFDELVRQGTPLEEACYQVGFQNYSNFFRLYKKHTGMTPMQFKKQLLEK